MVEPPRARTRGAVTPGAASGFDDATKLARFDALYDHNAFGICFGEGDRIVAANDAFLALLAWPREDFEANPPTWRTIVPGAGSEADEAANRQAIATGTWEPIERTWRRRDGREVPVLIGGTVYDRMRFRWVAYAFDITRQREFERALARSEERLALAVRGSSVGIFDWDVAKGELFLSARAAEIIGRASRDDVVPAADVAAQLDPDDFAQWKVRLRAHFTARTPFKLEVRVHRGGGAWHWVRVLGQATFEGGRAVRMAGAIIDVQDRKTTQLRLEQSERRHELALRATSDGIFEFVNGRETVWCSARSAEILELDEIPNGGEVPWLRAITGQSPDDVQRQRDALAESLATGRPYDLTLSRMKLDGTTQWLRVRAFPDPGSAPGEVVCVGSISDITADVAAREALRASEARLWQAQKMDALGTFASAVAHDFNNLISVIQGYVEVGLSARPEGMPAQALQEIGVASRRARELLGQVLSFSRRGGGAGRALDSAAASVPAAIRETRQLLASTGSVEITVTETVADALPEARIEEGALRQVLLNLAMNALHAMKADGGTLTFEAEPHDGEGPVDIGGHSLPAGAYVRVTVSDTGCGIPAELLDRVVEPFFTTKAQGEGTGLGLSVVHGLVRSAGGALQLRSAPGAGTTVAVWLPASDAATTGGR